MTSEYFEEKQFPNSNSIIMLHIKGLIAQVFETALYSKILNLWCPQ